LLTGWTIRGLKEQKPEFQFDDRRHDHGSKVVLGQLIEGGGQEEGKKVIHLLATHPSTARFLSLKLARRPLLAEVLVRHLGIGDLAAVFPGRATAASAFPGVIRV
jgi:uncharacterized protein (DUF1800 family)